MIDAVATDEFSIAFPQAETPESGVIHNGSPVPSVILFDYQSFFEERGAELSFASQTFYSAFRQNAVHVQDSPYQIEAGKPKLRPDAGSGLLFIPPKKDRVEEVNDVHVRYDRILQGTIHARRDYIESPAVSILKSSRSGLELFLSS